MPKLHSWIYRKSTEYYLSLGRVSFEAVFLATKALLGRLLFDFFTPDNEDDQKKRITWNVNKQEDDAPGVGRDKRFLVWNESTDFEGLSFGLLFERTTDPDCLFEAASLLVFILMSVFSFTFFPLKFLFKEEVQPLISEWVIVPLVRAVEMGFLVTCLVCCCILVSFFGSVVSSSCGLMDSSFRLTSRKRFSHGRTAIHLSSQFHPQLLLSGSYPAGGNACLAPACHFNQKIKKSRDKKARLDC